MDDLSCFEPSNLLHTQERMERYRPGGFHPIKLGDTFSGGRYTIHHKLGWGGFSTVWLARDESLNRWVSLKITTATDPESSRELALHQKLRQAGAADGVVQLLDSFIHEGPNGKHQCLVFELLGPTVDSVIFDYHEGGDSLEPETVLKITRQLLQALAAMHRAGYAHGDVSGVNVAFTASRLSELTSADDIFEVIGAPKTENLVRCDGKPLSPGIPEQLVERAGWDDWFDEDDEDVRLIDFGESFPHDAPRAHLSEPGWLQTPERIFTGRFDHRVDLWRAGCTIYGLLMGTRAFMYLGDMDFLVAQMIHFVEDLPEEWRPQWEEMQKSTGRIQDDIPDRMTGPSKVEEMFEKNVTEPNLGPLLPIIKGLMRFRPEDRISAEEALELLDGGAE